MVDTHCHLQILVRNFAENETYIPFNAQELTNCATILNEAEQNQVDTIINVGTNVTESLLSIQLTKHFANCFATIGLHPNDATDTWQKNMLDFEKMILNDLNPQAESKMPKSIVGIGECGIDKHYPHFNLQQQQDVFHAQIKLALKYNLPLVIHSRDADLETYQALAHYQGEQNLRGTIHCFSSNEIYAQKYIDLGFVLGFGGTVTYPKNETLRNVAKIIPLEKIILETDAPFLPPQSMRGKKNSPANIKIIAEFIAALRDQNFEHVAQTTTQTSLNLFKIKK